MNFGSVGPYPGASQTVGGSTLPASPTPRQIFTKTSGGSEGLYVSVSAGSWVGPLGTGTGTVTSVSGTANQISVASGTTTPVISLPSAVTLPGSLTVTTTSVHTGITTQSVGQTTSAATDLLINPAVKASGNFIDAQVGGSTRFSVSSVGGVTSSSNILASGDMRAGGAGRIYFLSRGGIKSPADSQLTLYNNALDDFSLLQFGGVSSSFPALKRSTTTLAVRLADDSADAPITASSGTFSGAVKSTSATANTGGGYGRLISEATVTLSGASGSIAVNIPVGARLLGAQLRVDTAITSGDGGTTWAAAYAGGSTQAITTGQAFTKNTKVNTMFDSFAATPIVVGSVATITITPNAGTFSAGVVRAVVYYDDFTALSNNP